MNSRVTVLLPVRNGEAVIAKAVRSLLAQSYRNFDLLVLDDASTDATARLCARFNDSRLRVVRNESALGVTRTLNRGLTLARGEYVARMDADDESLPHRFRKQTAYLDANPAIGVCGSWVRNFGGRRSYLARYPCEPGVLRAYSLFGNPLAHPAVMFRRELFASAGLTYDENIPVAQDYDLWVRALAVTDIANLPEALLRYREHAGSVTSSRRAESEAEARRIQRKLIAALGMPCSDSEGELHRRVGQAGGMPNKTELAAAESWLVRLAEANRRTRRYREGDFARAAGFVWFRACLNSARGGLWALPVYWQSRFRGGYRPSPGELTTLVMMGLLARLRAPPGSSGARGERDR